MCSYLNPNLHIVALQFLDLDDGMLAKCTVVDHGVKLRGQHSIAVLILTIRNEESVTLG